MNRLNWCAIFSCYMMMWLGDSVNGQKATTTSAPVDQAKAKWHDGVKSCQDEECWENCRCQEYPTPGGLDPDELPQFVLVNFQGLVTEEHKNLIHFLIQDFVVHASTACPVRATLFAQGLETNYMLLNHLANSGNDIGTMGISDVSEDHPSDYNMLRYRQEIVHHREIIAQMANLDLARVQMSRAPALAMGGDDYLAGLDTPMEFPMTDASLVSHQPAWPYTLDFRQLAVESCLRPPCRELAYKGLWEMPMYALHGHDDFPCFYVEDCPLAASTEDGSAGSPLRDMLMANFKQEAHYSGQRFPFVLNFRNASFLEDASHLRQVYDFLQSIILRPGVHVVTMSQLLEWTQNPIPMVDFEARRQADCQAEDPELTACQAQICYYNLGNRHLKSTTCLGRCSPVLPTHENAHDIFHELGGGGGYLGANPSYEARLKSRGRGQALSMSPEALAAFIRSKTRIPVIPKKNIWDSFLAGSRKPRNKHFFHMLNSNWDRK